MRRNGKRGLSLNFPGPTIEDRAWMLENFTGPDIHKSAIEVAHFGNIEPGAGRLWNAGYVAANQDSWENAA